LVFSFTSFASALHVSNPTYFSHEDTKTLHQNLSSLVDAGRFDGAYIVGSKSGKVVLKEVVGYHHQGSHPFFRLFSMTKPITAVLTLQLAEEGKLSLDDEIAMYLPELAHLTVYDGVTDFFGQAGPWGSLQNVTTPTDRSSAQKDSAEANFRATSKADSELLARRQGFLSHPATRNATIRELLTHTAGFAYGDNLGHPVDDAYDEALLTDFYGHTEIDFLRTLADIPLLTEPGTEFHYSLGFDVLGVLLGRVGKKPLDVLMKEKVFELLSMHETGFFIPMKKLWRLAPMKVAEDMEGLGAKLTELSATEDPPFKSGGGGLISTAQDYLKFANMLLRKGKSKEGRQVLGEKSVEAMTSNQLLPHQLPYHMAGFPDFEGSGFGYGVMVVGDGEVSPSSPLGEVSWAGLASNSWWISPQQDTALVAMTQVIPFDRTLEDLVKPFFYKPFLHEGNQKEEEKGGGSRSLRGSAERLEEV
jgi:CubicO group peptidase (beta-lactamase class C family)